MVLAGLVTVVAMVVAPSVRPASAEQTAGLEGVPRLKHVFTIVLENEDFNASWGPASPARYLNSLVPQGAFASQYYGTSHVSAGNYMAMTSAQTPTPLFQSDCLNWGACETFEKALPDGGRSVADQLEEQGLSWLGSMDSMSRPCQHPAATDPVDTNQMGYATRHNPFVYYPPIVENQARCDAHVRPYTELPQVLAGPADAVPNYVFITPDTCNDGHDAPCADGRPGGLVSADVWLQANVPLILNSPAFADRGALVITFDEAAPQDDSSGCCASGVPPIGVNGGGRIGALVLSPLVKPGTTSATKYDHASLLRTFEDGFGIAEHLNNAGSTLERPMADLFNVHK
jgi:hypothetical protein